MIDNSALTSTRMMDIVAGPPARRYICLCPPRVVRLETCPVTLNNHGLNDGDDDETPQ